MITKILITLGCLLGYFLLVTLLAGLVLFIGCGIYSVWELFVKIIS